MLQDCDAGVTARHRICGTSPHGVAKGHAIRAAQDSLQVDHARTAGMICINEIHREMSHDELK